MDITERKRMEEELRQAKEAAEAASRAKSAGPCLPAIRRANVSLRILVAEDNELSAEVLEQILIRHGHEVRLANNGREALSLVEEGCYDLLLLDVHLPELDGFQVVPALREARAERWRTFACDRFDGGPARKVDRERCLAAGVDEFLTKPVRSAELWAAMDRVVGVRGQTAEVRGQRSEVSPARQKFQELHSRAGGQKPDAAPLAPDLGPPTSGPGLLDLPVLLAGCGGDAGLLKKMCQTLQSRVPERLATLHAALRNQRRPRLARSGAQILRPVVGVFHDRRRPSGQPGRYCSSPPLDEALPVLEELEKMANELVQLAGELSLDALLDHMRER